MSFNRLLCLFPLACVLLFSQGCASLNSAMGGNTQKEAKAEVSWDFERYAIQIALASDEGLNSYAGQPHTVVMGVFQTADAKEFTQLLGDSERLKQIIATGKASPEFIQLDRYVVSPGKHTILNIDRVQDARFVGIVAGYYDFDRTTAARLFRIPLNIETSGLISTSYSAQPAHLALHLQLGRSGIVNARSLTFDPDKKATVETIQIDQKELEIELNDKSRTDPEISSGAAKKLRN